MGIVTEVGSNVHRFKVGDHVGVGTYVNSCRDCAYCNDGLEVICEKGLVITFNGVDVDGTVTKGGYSSYIIVHERLASCIIKLVLLAFSVVLSLSDINITLLITVDS